MFFKKSLRMLISIFFFWMMTVQSSEATMFGINDNYRSPRISEATEKSWITPIKKGERPMFYTTRFGKRSVGGSPSIYYNNLEKLADQDQGRAANKFLEILEDSCMCNGYNEQGEAMICFKTGPENIYSCRPQLLAS